MRSIRYSQQPDNCAEVIAFIGPVPPCPRCHDTGEYEGDHGPIGCMPCCSRLIPVPTAAGIDYIDWDDVITEVSPGVFVITRGSNW